jgi:hypothetical protein
MNTLSIMHPIPPSGPILSFRAAIACALLSCVLPLAPAARALAVSAALVDYQLMLRGSVRFPSLSSLSSDVTRLRRTADFQVCFEAHA